MNRKYVRHEPDYAIGENEALYAAMAEKGWFLTKRGANFSRFERGDPRHMRYRIELAAPGWMDEQEMPDEQLALYEECGWRLAAHSGLVYVFCAPAGSDAPELYSDPRQQAGMLRALRRQYRTGWLAALALVAFNLLLGAAVRGSLDEVAADFLSGLRLSFVESTALVLGYGALCAAAIYDYLCGAVSTMRLYRRLKRGEPIDHAPHHRRVRRRIGDALGALVVVFALLAVWQWAGKTAGPLPDAADGPYLIIEDLASGARTEAFGRENSLAVTRSLAARHYDVYESVQTPSGEDLWLYEDVYELRSPALAMTAARALMEQAALAHGRESFVEYDVPGLDRAVVQHPDIHRHPRKLCVQPHVPRPFGREQLFVRRDGLSRARRAAGRIKKRRSPHGLRRDSYCSPRKKCARGRSHSKCAARQRMSTTSTMPTIMAAAEPVTSHISAHTSAPAMDAQA